MTLLRALERYARPPRSQHSGDRCELCGAALERDHPHLADIERRALACACRACGLLFTEKGAGGGRWRTIPDRHVRDPAFALGDADWSTLAIPVSMAFFFKSSRSGGWTAVYPSPAGPVESMLSMDAWDGVVARSSLARAIEPDLEALLVIAPRRGEQSARYECMLVPIHACYALVGAVRRCWRGFDGGEEARARIAEHISALRGKCIESVYKGVAS